MRTAAIALLLAGCAGLPGAPTNPSLVSSWGTLKAEHYVRLDVKLPDGKELHREMRGVIAIERPDKFRLRALGPGGLLLFDIICRGTYVKVIEAIRDPEQGVFGKILRSLASDLQAAYDLEPTPKDRTRSIAEGALLVEDPERTVRLTDFHNEHGQAIFYRADITNRQLGYHIELDVNKAEIDPTLDPKMFQP